jgi:hypothetical protein
MFRIAIAVLAGAVVLALTACGGSELGGLVKNGVRDADELGQGSTRIHVTDPETGESKSLEYLHEGTHWIYHGCEILEDVGTESCSEPSDAPDVLNP